MLRSPALRHLLLLSGLAAPFACNVYSEDLLTATDADGGTQSGGAVTGGERGSGGWVGGYAPTGGLRGSGGAIGGSAGSPDAGGTGATGGAPEGGTAATGGTGGAAPAGGSGNSSLGGANLGGANLGGANLGGTPMGGTSSGTGGTDLGGTGGAATGGTETGGSNPGGAETGGAGVNTGGTETGGAPTGGAPTGGASTGGSLPVGFTVIDMLDIVNNTIELSDGVGFWYVFHDESAGGVITPDTQGDSSLELKPTTVDPARDGNTLAVHVVANDQFLDWGAGVGFDLDAPNSTTRNQYDASRYGGIVFWARSGLGSVDMRFRVVTADIVPSSDPGGECTSNCDDTFGTTITLTETWQEYAIDLASPPLVQQGWGYAPPAFDPSATLAIQWQAAVGVAFDIWIDDVRFYDAGVL